MRNTQEDLAGQARYQILVRHIGRLSYATG